MSDKEKIKILSKALALGITSQRFKVLRSRISMYEFMEYENRLSFGDKMHLKEDRALLKKITRAYDHLVSTATEKEIQIARRLSKGNNFYDL